MKNSILNQLHAGKNRLKNLMGLLSFLLLLIFFIPTQSEAYCVFNKTSYEVNYRVHGTSTNGTITYWLGGSMKVPESCKGYLDIDKKQTDLITIEVHIDKVQFNTVITTEAGGYLYVEYHEEESGIDKTIKVTSYSHDRKILDVRPQLSTPGNRDIHFLATADPQYYKDNIEEENIEWLRALTVMTKVAIGVKKDTRNRGVIVAGDLTGWSRNVEWQEYEKPFKGYTRYLYDGLGNHDLEPGNCCFESGSLDQTYRGYCICPEEIAEAIGNRFRSSPLTGRSGPNYSWDWHDIHFVQLNLFPGNGKRSNAERTDERYNTYNSLLFLVTDLAKNVGNSGRPVVLIHHYGLEGFSRGDCNITNTDTDSFGSLNKEGEYYTCGYNSKGEHAMQIWWTQEQRVAYWNAIANYNVPLIITGHLHNTKGTDWWKIKWKRPKGLTNGPESIQTVTAGGAMNGGYYIDVGINNNEIVVEKLKCYNPVYGTTLAAHSLFDIGKQDVISTTIIDTVKIQITKPGEKPSHLASEEVDGN